MQVAAASHSNIGIEDGAVPAALAHSPMQRHGGGQEGHENFGHQAGAATLDRAAPQGHARMPESHVQARRRKVQRMGRHKIRHKARHKN